MARARTASIESASRLPSPLSAHAVSAASAFVTAVWSRLARSAFSRATWLSRTAWLSMSSVSIGASSSSLYLLTPTMTSSPESIRACFSAALASIFSLAHPLCTAFVMPPIASISSMIFQAASAICWVSASIA